MSFSSALTFALLCAHCGCVCVCVLNSITDQQKQQQQRHFLALCYLKREYTESETVSCLAIGHFACHTLFLGCIVSIRLARRKKERKGAKRCVSDGKPPPLLLLLLLALMMDDEHTAIHWQKQCTTATTAIISVQQTGQNVAVRIYRRYRELTPELCSVLLLRCISASVSYSSFCHGCCCAVAVTVTVDTVGFFLLFYPILCSASVCYCCLHPK